MVGHVDIHDFDWRGVLKNDKYYTHSLPIMNEVSYIRFTLNALRIPVTCTFTENSYETDIKQWPPEIQRNLYF